MHQEWLAFIMYGLCVLSTVVFIWYDLCSLGTACIYKVRIVCIRYGLCLLGAACSALGASCLY